VESYGDKRSCIELAVPTGDGANARIGQWDKKRQFIKDSSQVETELNEH
jgi:hypothetical protein